MAEDVAMAVCGGREKSFRPGKVGCKPEILRRLPCKAGNCARKNGWGKGVDA
jgi:hypothetical protein